MEQYMPFIWIGFAVLMAVCEAFTSQLVSIWFVLGSVCAALLVTRPLINKWKQKKDVTSTNADRLIGKIGIVLADIEDVQKVGQVKVEGEIWTAKSQYAPISKDSKVKVLSIEGVKLIVEPTENIEE